LSLFRLNRPHPPVQYNSTETQQLLLIYSSHQQLSDSNHPPWFIPVQDSCVLALTHDTRKHDLRPAHRSAPIGHRSISAFPAAHDFPSLWNSGTLRTCTETAQKEPRNFALASFRRTRRRRGRCRHGPIRNSLGNSAARLSWPSDARGSQPKN
jgi:hypothetical protein